MDSLEKTRLVDECSSEKTRRIDEMQIDSAIALEILMRGSSFDHNGITYDYCGVGEQTIVIAGDKSEYTLLAASSDKKQFLVMQTGAKSKNPLIQAISREELHSANPNDNRFSFIPTYAGATVNVMRSGHTIDDNWTVHMTEEGFIMKNNDGKSRSARTCTMQKVIDAGYTRIALRGMMVVEKGTKWKVQTVDDIRAHNPQIDQKL